MLKFVRRLPRDKETGVLARQLLRSATSVAANYRAVQRARSINEFAAKLGVVVEEADETQFWLELLREANLCDKDAGLTKESGELVAIFTASHKTVRARIRVKKKAAQA